MTDDEWADLEERVNERGYEFFGGVWTRGNLVLDITGGEEWLFWDLYAEDLTPFDGSKPCPKCQAVHETDDRDGAHEPDKCWGWISGVIGGCCGHGIDSPCLTLEDGTRLNGDEVTKFLDDAS